MNKCCNYRVTEFSDSEKHELNNVGLRFYPNYLLNKARKQIHPLNLLLIGAPQTGKSSLINTFLSESVFNQQHQVNEDQLIECFEMVKVEGGVQVKVQINKIRGFKSAEVLEDEQYRSRIISFLSARQQECHDKEMAVQRDTKRIFDGIIHAIFYFIPPTFSHFTPHEISFFQEVQKHSTLIPLISKADIYTANELKLLKMKIRAQFQAAKIPFLPDLVSQYPDQALTNELDEIIQNKWPLAVISAESVEAGEGGSRSRNYPWGVVDVDNTDYCDLHYLEKLLINSFYCYNQQNIIHSLYESIWRNSFLQSEQPQPTATSENSILECSPTAVPMICIDSGDKPRVFGETQSCSSDSVVSKYSQNEIKASLSRSLSQNPVAL